MKKRPSFATAGILAVALAFGAAAAVPGAQAKGLFPLTDVEMDTLAQKSVIILDDSKFMPEKMNAAVRLYELVRDFDGLEEPVTDTFMTMLRNMNGGKSDPERDSLIRTGMQTLTVAGTKDSDLGALVLDDLLVLKNHDDPLVRMLTAVVAEYIAGAHKSLAARAVVMLKTMQAEEKDQEVSRNIGYSLIRLDNLLNPSGPVPAP